MTSPRHRSLSLFIPFALLACSSTQEATPLGSDSARFAEADHEFSRPSRGDGAAVGPVSLAEPQEVGGGAVVTADDGANGDSEGATEQSSAANWAAAAAGTYQNDREARFVLEPEESGLRIQEYKKVGDGWESGKDLGVFFYSHTQSLTLMQRAVEGVSFFPDLEDFKQQIPWRIIFLLHPETGQPSMLVMALEKPGAVFSTESTMEDLRPMGLFLKKP